MRRFALLVGSVVSVVVLGVLAVWSQLSAATQVGEVHRADRVTLQQTLAGLTEQYVKFTFLATNTAAVDTNWHLTLNSPADRVALAALVRSSPLTSYGAAVVSLTGDALTSYPGPSVLPAPTDRGFAVMRRELLSGQPGLSDVMRGDGTPVVAFAVPINRGGHPAGLLVMFANLRSWPLQGYNAGLRIASTAESFVLDSAGVIVAARDSHQIGQRLATLPPHVGGRAAITTVQSHGKAMTVSYGPAGNGWTAVTVEPTAAFSGGLIHGRNMELLTLAFVLSLAVLLLIVFHHKRQQALARLADERLYDPLTGLGQRGVFEMRVDAALARRRRHQRPLAVLFCDLDNFKAVNDRHGHNTGDQLLAAVARRITQAVRDTDMVARLGGDEFAVVMDETSAEEAQRIVERIRSAVGADLDLNGRHFAPRISIGVAILATGERSADELLHEADMAMYQAKRDGRGYAVITATPTPPTDASVPTQRAMNSLTRGT